MGDYLAAWGIYLVALSLLSLVAGAWLWSLRGRLWVVAAFIVFCIFNLTPVQVVDGVYAPFMAGFAVDVIAGKLELARYALSFVLASFCSALLVFGVYRFGGNFSSGDGGSDEKDC